MRETFDGKFGGGVNSPENHPAFGFFANSENGDLPEGAPTIPDLPAIGKEVERVIDPRLVQFPKLPLSGVIQSTREKCPETKVYPDGNFLIYRLGGNGRPDCCYVSSDMAMTEYRVDEMVKVDGKIAKIIAIDVDGYSLIYRLYAEKGFGEEESVSFKQAYRVGVIEELKLHEEEVDAKKYVPGDVVMVMDGDSVFCYGEVTAFDPKTETVVLRGKFGEKRIVLDGYLTLEKLSDEAPSRPEFVRGGTIKVRAFGGKDEYVEWKILAFLPESLLVELVGKSKNVQGKYPAVTELGLGTFALVE